LAPAPLNLDSLLRRPRIEQEDGRTEDLIPIVQEHGVVRDPSDADPLYLAALDSGGGEGGLGRDAEGGVPVFRVLLHPARLGIEIRVFRLGCAEYLAPFIHDDGLAAA
jgi:hypothetical protein